MATSSCPKCENTSFEVKEAQHIEGTIYNFIFFQCASCGAVVGVTEKLYLASLLSKIADKLGLKLF
jgi:predicted nucleic-acid-binding Zn-ribbon protein